MPGPAPTKPDYHRLRIGELTVALTRKDVKNVHLSVHPPDGRVTLVTPPPHHSPRRRPRLRDQRASIGSASQQQQLADQAREAPRNHVTRETHLLWGHAHLLDVREDHTKPTVTHDHQHITLTVRPGSDAATRARVMHDWHKSLLHEAIPPMIQRWEPKLGVTVARYFLQRMKTKWGSCSPASNHIRLNTELVKKPRHLLEYVIVHEMTHLLEPTHNDRFLELLTRHYPTWQAARTELNDLPLGAEVWAAGDRNRGQR